MNEPNNLEGGCAYMYEPTKLWPTHSPTHTDMSFFDNFMVSILAYIFIKKFDNMQLFTYKLKRQHSVIIVIPSE